MRADREIHLAVGLVYDCARAAECVPADGIFYQQLKLERIALSRLVARREGEGHGISALLFESKHRVARKAVLRHLIFAAAVAILSVQKLADYREENRRSSVPD